MIVVLMKYGYSFIFIENIAYYAARVGALPLHVYYNLQEHFQQNDVLGLMEMPDPFTIPHRRLPGRYEFL